MHSPTNSMIFELNKLMKSNYMSYPNPLSRNIQKFDVNIFLIETTIFSIVFFLFENILPLHGAYMLIKKKAPRLGDFQMKSRKKKSYPSLGIYTWKIERKNLLHPGNLLHMKNRKKKYTSSGGFTIEIEKVKNLKKIQ